MIFTDSFNRGGEDSLDSEATPGRSLCKLSVENLCDGTNYTDFGLYVLMKILRKVSPEEILECRDKKILGIFSSVPLFMVLGIRPIEKFRQLTCVGCKIGCRIV